MTDQPSHPSAEPRAEEETALEQPLATTGAPVIKAKRNLANEVLHGMASPPSPPSPDEGIPHDLPYTPLGARGDYLFLLDAAKTFLPLRRKELANAGTIFSIFAGAPGSLFRLYPLMSSTKGGVVKRVPDRYRQNKVIDDLTRLCAQAGLFHPETQIRGRGAWLDRDDKGRDRLVVHFGGLLTLGGRSIELTKLHGFAYPSMSPALPRPHDQSVSRSQSSGDWLVRQLDQ